MPLQSRRSKKVNKQEVHTGSGNAKASRGLWKLNKWMTLVAFVVVFGGIGSYLLFYSHADNTQVPCSNSGGGHYTCNFYQVPTPIVNGSGSRVGTFKYSHANWILCQQQGVEVHNGSYYNDWWGWTNSDENTWGWVNAVYGSGGVNNGSFSNAPNCNRAHGSPPQPVSAPAPRPAPKPVPKPVVSTPKVVVYNGNNDGCGGNATHYDGSTHVGQSNYGSGSTCKCDNGKVIAYGAVYQTTTPNPGCATPVVSKPATPTVVAYNGNNDGCGGNATHYDGSTHVGQSNYGTNSTCKCDNGRIVAYSKPYQTMTPNPGCNVKGPTPAPTPTSSKVVAYNGNNDGCGGNATHYDGSTHVGQSNYGSGSTCKCDNGISLAYGKAYQTTTPNSGCNIGDNTRGSSGSNTGSGSTYQGDGCGGNATKSGNATSGYTCVCNNGINVSYPATRLTNSQTNHACDVAPAASGCAALHERQVGSECVPTGNSCSNINGGKMCNGAVTCDAGYYAVYVTMPVSCLRAGATNTRNSAPVGACAGGRCTQGNESAAQTPEEYLQEQCNNAASKNVSLAQLGEICSYTN